MFNKYGSQSTFCVNQAFYVVVGSSICGGDTKQQMAQQSLSQMEFGGKVVFNDNDISNFIPHRRL
jgi:ABC-type proline/glycine betaine transport system ATPase subunit